MLRDNWFEVNINFKNFEGEYDTIWYIYVRSKADKMASLIWRTAQKQKIKEKLKTKTD